MARHRLRHPTAPTGAVLLAGALLVAGSDPCLAQQAADPGRFTLSSTGDGFVRLDTLTGAVSHCQQVAGVWTCAPTDEVATAPPAAQPDDETAARIAALERSVAALQAELSERERSAAEVVAAGGPAEAAPTAAKPAAPAGLGPQLTGRLARMAALLKAGMRR